MNRQPIVIHVHRETRMNDKSNGATLNETEAALRLGITKELLYSYVRNPPKTFLGHTTTLPTTMRDGRMWFSAADLDEWDAYLWEPWAGPTDKRPDVPHFI